MIVRTHHRSESVKLQDYACDGAHRPPSRTETTAEYEVIFVRRGVFKLWTHRREQVVTPNEVLFLRPGSEYAVSHPVAGGDDCTVVACSPELLEPISRRDGNVRVAPVTSKLFHDQMTLFARASRKAASTLEIEERLFDLVAASVAHFDDAGARRLTAAPRQRRYVRRAQEVIAAYCTEPLPLTTIASLSGTSPFHLSRLFRECTGTSLHRYQTTLRLRHALRRILDGEPDIGALALDTGFSSHSHFTAAFRREFGVAPRLLRSG